MPSMTWRWSRHCMPRCPFFGSSGMSLPHAVSVSSPHLATLSTTSLRSLRARLAALARIYQTHPSKGLRPFACKDTLVTFLWYGVFAGGGLRSVGEDALPSSTSVCSILPTARFCRGAYVVLREEKSMREGQTISEMVEEVL